jgi:pilus assembly protein CpaC
MHRSSKQRRQKLVRRWKRALFAAMCAAGFATSSFSFGEELAPVRKKLPTKSVTPAALTREAASEPAAPAVKPASPATRLLGAKSNVFRPIAIEVTPEATTENAPKAAEPSPLKIVATLTALPKPEAKAKTIPSRLPMVESKPVEDSSAETPAPIVAASSMARLGQKLVELKPIHEKPAEVSAEKAETDLDASPLSPWMQDIRNPEPELKPVAKAETPAPMVAATPIAAEPIAAPAPERLPTPVAASTLPTKLTIFERAAMPTFAEASEAEVTAAQVVEGEDPQFEQKQPAEFVPPQEPAPIVAAPIVSSPNREMVVNKAREPKLLVPPSKPLRGKAPAKSEVRIHAKSESNFESDPAPKPAFRVEAKTEPLVLAVQNAQPGEKNAAQPPADQLPGPDKDKDLKKHFEVIQQTGEFSVQVHRSKLLRTVKDIYRTAVVDDAVLEIVQFTPREISLIGRSQGTTHVTFWFDDPATQPVTYLVTVEPDAGQVAIEEKKYQMLEDMINEMFPDSKIHMQLIANKLVVRGQARDSEEAFQIMTLIRAQGMGMGAGMGGGIGGMGGGFGFGGINEGQAADPLQDSATGAARRSNYQIINMLRVPGVQQVALRVKIAELNRTAARNFGMNLQGHIDVGDSSKILLNSVLGNNGGQSQPSVLFNIDGDDLSISLNTLQQHGVIKLLSEPTLVTLSGNPATFIAGGEFAVPTIVGSAGLNAVTTDFRAFGAIISFLPTVVDKDRVRLQVAPEFSQINSGLTVNGTPGLKVRAATTTVEMREGQTLAIAGLLEDNINANTAGDLPFLWKIIGKRGVTRAETELIILVTPELVHPMEPEEVPPLPGFDVTEPTSKQFYLHGDIEGNPTMDYRSTVWPMLKKRYKAGGPAMTSGPFGHGQ